MMNDPPAYVVPTTGRTIVPVGAVLSTVRCAIWLVAEPNELLTTATNAALSSDACTGESV